MQQNTNQYLKYVIALFVIFLISSVVLYFFPSQGKVKWMELEQAMEKSKLENKPVLLYPYIKWLAKNKIAAKSIFSNDSTVKYINETFIPAGLNLEEEKDLNIAKSRYKIDNGNYCVVLDKYGRGVGFLDNSWSGTVFKEFANEILKYKYFEFDYYDEAKTKAAEQNKNMLIFITNNYFQNISTNELLKDDSLYNFIKTNYIPVAMMTYEDWDKSIIKKYFDENDPILISFKVELLSGNTKLQTSQPVNLLLVSPDEKLIDRIILDKDDIDLLSKLKEFNKNIQMNNGGK